MQIDDLFVVLYAQNAPLLEGLAASGAAGEKLAADMAVSMTQIDASLDGAALSTQRLAVAADEMALQGQADLARMAEATAAASAKMEAATVRAAEANTVLGEKLAANSTLAGRSAAQWGMAAAGVALVGGVTIKMAGDFESATNRLVTSAGEIHSNLDMVRQGILQMAGEVGDSAMDLAKAMYTIESGGQHGADGLKVLRAAAEGAKAENADLVTTADAVTSVLVDYHLKASDAATVTSKLVAATSAGKTTFQELAGAMSQVLPVASAAHVSLDDILGDLASMTVHGMSAQQAAQNLTDVINHMQAPTATQAKELALLGMTTNQLADDLKSKGLSGTLGEISERIQHMMPPGGERVILDMRTALHTLPPAVQELGMRLAEGSITMKEYTNAAKGLDPVSAKQAASFAALAGSTHRIGDEQMTGAQVMQNYGQALAKATGDATGLRTSLMLTGENADTTKNAINRVAGASTEAGGHVKGWSDIQHTFNQRAAQAKDGLGALAIQVGERLLPPVSVLLGYFADLAKWLSQHPKLATVLAAALGVMAVAFTIAAVAVWAMNSALLANPITWIILAIVAAIALIAFGIYELATHWKTIWGAIKSAAEAVWHWLVDAWHATVDAIVGAFHTVVNFFTSLPGRIMAGIHALGAALKSGAKAAFDSFFFTVGFVIGSVIKFFMDLPGKISAAFHLLAHAVAVGWNESVAWFEALPGRVGNILARLPGIMVNWLSNAWNQGKAIVSSGINAVASFMESLPGRAYNAMMNVYHNVVNVLSGAGSWLYNAGRNIINGLINGVESAIGGAIDAARRAMADVVNGAKAALGIRSPSTVFAELGAHTVAGFVQGITNNASKAADAVSAMLGLGTSALSVPSLAGVAGYTTGRGVAPTVAASSAGGGAPIVVQLHADGKKLYEVIVPHAQRHKGRNPTTALG